MNIDYYLNEVVETLNLSEINLMGLSRDTGLSYTLIRELKSGKRKNCTISTLSIISKKLSEKTPDKKCQDCKFYDNFDDGSHYCRAHNGGSHDEPIACYAHKPL